MRTLTGSAFFTNESACHAMVTGLQSRGEVALSSVFWVCFVDIGSWQKTLKVITHSLRIAKAFTVLVIVSAFSQRLIGLVAALHSSAMDSGATRYIPTTDCTNFPLFEYIPLFLCQWRPLWCFLQGWVAFVYKRTAESFDCREHHQLF